MSKFRETASPSVATEAADWYTRLRAPDVSELEATRFRAWLAGDPERRREFEAIDALWNDLAAIEDCPEVQRVRRQIAARRRPRQLRRPAQWAMAAMVLIAISGALFAWRQSSVNRFVTEIGEQRTVPLADGSVVMLNTDTELRLRYSDTTRGIDLVRGQASFEVAKDPVRPFVVRAGEVAVRAVGTVFDVYRTGDKVTVTLIEGKVAVTHEDEAADENSFGGIDNGAQASSGAASPAEVVLAAGEQVSYASSAVSVERAIADVPRVTAWRKRRLDFSDTPLLEAIAEANRYSREQIILAAPALEDARISGVFEAGKNDLFAEGLQSYFRLELERTADDKIILSAQ